MQFFVKGLPSGAEQFFCKGVSSQRGATVLFCIKGYLLLCMSSFLQCHHAALCKVCKVYATQRSFFALHKTGQPKVAVPSVASPGLLRRGVWQTVRMAQPGLLFRDVN